MARKVATGRSHIPGKSAIIFVNFLLHPVVIKIKMDDNMMFGMNSNKNIEHSSVRFALLRPPDPVPKADVNDMTSPLVIIEVMILRKHKIKRHVNSPRKIGQGPIKSSLVTPSEAVRIDITYDTRNQLLPV